MKFLYVTDSHFRAHDVAVRTDNYVDTSIQKLEAILTYAEGKNIRTIVHGGDFFDSYNESYGIFTRVADTIRCYPDIHWQKRG